MIKLSEEYRVNGESESLRKEKLDLRSLRKGVIFLLASQLVVLLLPSKSNAAEQVFFDEATQPKQSILISNSR